MAGKHGSRRRAQAFVLGLLATVQGGCAARVPLLPQHAADRPPTLPAESTPVGGQPAATLRGDDIDAPAATSLREAEHAAELARAMGGHAMHHGAAYRHTDAGREAQPSPSPKPSPHRHHQSDR
jgi:hypothetical protein